MIDGLGCGPPESRARWWAVGSKRDVARRGPVAADPVAGVDGRAFGGPARGSGTSLMDQKYTTRNWTAGFSASSLFQGSVLGTYF